MSKEIYYIRHGESYFNANPDKDDCYDCDLTELGKLQCKELGKKLANVEFDYIIISPLLRCLQTFKLSGVLSEKVIVMDECREYKQNKCDFLTGEEIIYETETDIIKRVATFKSILEKYDGKRIAVFTHGDFIFYGTAVKNDDDDEYFGTWLDNSEYLVVFVKE